jgi:nucleotide-binding universal stress UspA family protein
VGGRGLNGRRTARAGQGGRPGLRRARRDPAILSHRSFEELFDAAETHDADTLVMGWGADSHGLPGRAESAMDELAGCPATCSCWKTAGSTRRGSWCRRRAASELGAAVARFLRDQYGSEVTLLHVAAEGEAFLDSRAVEYGFADAERRVETGDVETAIEGAAADASMLVVGATERGLLQRLVRGTVVLDDVECSVVLAETRRSRSLTEQPLG